jgi:hypothetical protein
MKTGLKKIYIKAVVKDSFDGAIVRLHRDLVALSEYREEIIKHEDAMSKYTFDALRDYIILFISGVWQASKGLFGMSTWVFVLAWEGVRWLAKYAFGGGQNGKREKIK